MLSFPSFFESLHPDFQNVSDGLYLLAPEQLAEDFRFIEFAGALKRQGIKLLGAKGLKSWRYNLNKPKLSMSTEEGADWFDLKIELSYGSQTAALKDIRQALVKKQDFVTLSDGSIGMLPESRLAGIAPYLQAGEVKKDRIRLNGLQFGIVDRLYEHLKEKPRFLQEMYERKQRVCTARRQTFRRPRGHLAPLPAIRPTGLSFCIKTVWAAVWPTTWVWEKPCKPLRFCII